MKLRKITALFAAAAVAASAVITAAAATEIAKEGTEIVLADTADGARADDTAAVLNVSWEEGKLIFNVAVTDSNLDNTNADLWQRDSIELRVDSMTEIRINGATGELSGGAADLYDVVWTLTDTGYEVTATYANADVKAGYEFTMAAQVNACSNGKRDCTIQLDAAQANAWQDDTVRTPMVLLGGAAVEETVVVETTSAAAGDTTAASAASKGSADTGIEGVAVIAGLAVIGTGAVLISRKRK